MVDERFVDSAIGMAAGLGTRSLEISRDTGKLLVALPGWPLADWLAHDIAESGIKRLVWVINEGDQLIRDHYNINPTRMRELQKRQMDAAMQREQQITSAFGLQVDFIEQPYDDPDFYGTGAATLLGFQKLAEIDPNGTGGVLLLNG